MTQYVDITIFDSIVRRTVITTAGENSLAAFGHEREGAFLLAGPITPDIGMSKVEISDRFDVHNIDYVPEAL